MLQFSPYLLLLALFGVESVFAQTAGVQPGTLANKTEPLSVPVMPDGSSPPISDVKFKDRASGEKHSHSNFLKSWSITSFGYSLAPTGLGFEFRSPFTGNPVGVPGLECPTCIARPQTEHSRFALPPFGAQAVRQFSNDHIELFGGFGGINAWSANGATIQVNGNPLAPLRSASPFNDEWLLELSGGGRFAVDHGRHLWLGADWRSVWNMGPTAPRQSQWKSVSGSATLQLGH
jgi:hypothetical protein